MIYQNQKVDEVQMRVKNKNVRSKQHAYLNFVWDEYDIIIGPRGVRVVESTILPCVEVGICIFFCD